MQFKKTTIKLTKNTVLFLGAFFCFISMAYSGNFLRLYEPTNNAVVSTNQIKFSWKQSPFNGNYQVQLSISPNFTTILKDTLVSTTEMITNVDSSGTIYWRVRVKGTNFVTCWSETGNFRLFKLTPVLWLDADKGITQSSGFISQWNDQSPSLNNAFQANSANQPLLVNAVTKLNNKAIVRLDGTNDFIQYNSVNNIRTVITVFKHRTGLQDFTSLLGHISNFDFVTDAGANLFSPSFSSNAVRNGDAYRNKGERLNPVVLTKPTEYTLLSLITTDNTRSDHMSSDRFSGSRFWDGDFASMLLFSEPLSFENKELTEDLLLYKYAPPVLIRDTIVNGNFCDSITVNASPMYKNYLWSSGRTSTSSKFLANGIHSVTVVDIFDKNSQSNFLVFPYNKLDNACVNLCRGQIFSLTLALPAGFSVLWQHNNSTNTTQSFNQNGQYRVAITDAKGCTFTDTINIIYDEPTINPSIPLNNNILLCEGEKLFINTPTSFDSILWSTGSSEDFITIINPGTYNIYAQTSVGCIFRDTFNVSIAGKAPTAKFGLNPACQGAELNFFDSTLVPQGNTIQSWKWNFSNGTSSTLEDPVSSFPNLGLASAALKVTTNVGCTDSIFKTFIVNRRPTPSFFNLLSCEGNPTVFVDQTIPNSASVVDWLWDFGGLGSSNGIQNPAFVFPAQGVYKITLKATNSNGCSDTTSLYTSVNSSPTANFSFDSVCGKTPVNLKFLATVQPPSIIPDLNWGKWNFGDGSEENAIRNPQHVYDEPGTYEVSLIVKSSNQCVDTVVKQVKVFDFPVVDFTVSQTQCVGKEIQFSDISATPDGTPINKWNWFFSGQGSDTVQNPRYTFNAQGNYTIQLTARNEVGCSNTKLRSIAVSAPPQPKFTFSPQNGLPPLNVTYNNQSPTNGNYLWSYGDGSPIVAGYNPPAHVYTTIGTYPIKLVATDFRGCTDTLTKFILVDRAYLDGVMAAITIIPTTDDYYKIQVTIINNSNIEITALGLSIQLGGGSVVRENWSGSLLPGQTTVYVFTGELKTGDNAAPVVCASIDNVNNNSFENRTDNNTTCKELSVGSFDILTIFPNPASDNNINFGIMLPKEGNVNIRFVDILGQQMYTRDFDGTRGYNQLTMPISMLNAAVYVAEVSFDGQVIYKKFMKKNRK